MSDKKTKLSNSIFLGLNQHINNTFIKNYKKNIIINVKKIVILVYLKKLLTNIVIYLK